MHKNDFELQRRQATGRYLDIAGCKVLLVMVHALSVLCQLLTVQCGLLSFLNYGPPES